MPNFDNNWLATDYEGVIKLLDGVPNIYAVPIEVKKYGCFGNESSEEKHYDVLEFLRELKDSEQLRDGTLYRHSVARENTPHNSGQNVDVSGIYQHIIRDKKRYDQELAAHPINHRQGTGTETHTIRITKNKLADTVEFLGELIEYEKPIVVGEEGRIEITYKQPQYGLAHGSCVDGACAF